MSQFSLRASRSRSVHAVTPLLRMRYWLVCLGMAVWVAFIISKLFWLQILRHKEFVEKAEKQQQQTFKVAPRRGILYDRNLRELAMTVQADSIYAVPSQIEDKQNTIHTLAMIVHQRSEDNPVDNWTSESQIMARVNASRGFAWIARRVTPETAAKAKALNLKGIYFQKEFQRFYPDNEIAAQVLGYVGVDDNGLGGMEQKFDSRLHGQPGRMFAAVDARRHVLGSTVHEPEPGENLILSLDENIQFLAEKALDAAIKRTRSENGTVVVQDVHTGQILALAIRPTFNPNDFRHTTSDLLRNHAVSDVYEPGSTFKLVTYAAALDQHLVKPDDMIDCQGGQITLYGRVIHDNQGEHLGVVPLHKALEQSSDVAAVKLALKMGQNRFYDYIQRFGFGIKSGIEVPAETRGLLRPPAKWGATSIGSIAIGQEVAVTPLQLVSMVSTIANGGVYLPPHLVLTPSTVQTQSPGALKSEASQFPRPQARPIRIGDEIPNPPPPGARRVISTMTAAQMRKLMEGVVLYGTGKEAQLNGYSSGGKTGTAQKVDQVTRAYSKTMHIASFAGFAPVNSPAIAVAVVLDNPQGDYYGSAASAPVFAQVAQQTLEYLRVPHDIEIQPPGASPRTPLIKDAEPKQQNTGDVKALIAAMNELPSDDPLREAVSSARIAAAAPRSKKNQPTERLRKEGTTSSQPIRGNTPEAAAGQAIANARHPELVQASVSSTAPSPAPDLGPLTANSIRMPSLIGLPLRQVVERIGLSGLSLDVTGRGLVRSQKPAPGAAVPVGSKVVVHCTR